MGSSEDRRTEIIHAVWQVIATQGMGAVTMRAVATAAGVSVGRIQYWFRSKDELLHASLEAMISGAATDYDAATATADPRRRVWELLVQSIPRADAARMGVSVFHQYAAAAINDPVLARMLTEAKQGQAREVGRLLVRIAPDLTSPRLAARSLIATSDGLTLQVLIGSLSPASAERTLRAALDRVLG
ncbi:MAG TPA: TetR/AcrR family transcriptional regulator [Candidatus Avipropionibacterium avicola]|uniref:TetR/AcrR family transcriptional regulator n=1 Tax=Candidatus Avipropionibacterium avicola TaxID=2840701 RepID=A0A9D1KNQ3_9ACTN|nr:TetR/AcrR family transcriptional regulator [Candidatus Avipropionibacterium avicola]